MTELNERMQYLFDVTVEFNLSEEEYNLVDQALTVRNTEADFDIVDKLLSAQISPVDFKFFFESLLVRANLPTDIYLLFAMHKAAKADKSDLKDYW
jgi:hypothetical protein